jgi:hypothetical protein
MALDTWIRDTPSLAAKDYKTRYSRPCQPRDSQQEFGFEWYVGTGIEPAAHPLEGHIRFAGCAACDSERVLVIMAQWNVSFSSGDAYWDYELECQACGKFTQRSYAGND